MFRLVFVLALAAGAFWLFQQPAPRWLSFWTRSHAETLREVSAEVLQPLDNDECFPVAEVGQTLQRIKQELGPSPTSPEDRRALQAIVLLQAAISERAGLFQRAAAGSSPSALDRVPGDWHIAGRPRIRVDRQKLNHQSRSAFFASNAVRKWEERLEYYRVSIDRLLRPQ